MKTKYSKALFWQVQIKDKSNIINPTWGGGGGGGGGGGIIMTPIGFSYVVSKRFTVRG